MSVVDEILEWVSGLEDWAQDLFLRVSTGSSLSTDEIAQTVAALANPDADPSRFLRLSQSDFSQTLSQKTRLRLLSIESLVNVNALTHESKLELAPEGLTVVYGGNGAGKTGYSRIGKFVGRTLARERVYGDVRASAGSPHASLTFDDGRGSQVLDVDLHGTPPLELRELRVFDVTSGERHITEENVVDYLPSALEGVERLAEAMSQVANELDRRIAEATPAPLELGVATDTEVGRALAQLNSVASLEQLRLLAKLTEEQETERVGARRRLQEIAARDAAALARVALQDAEAGRRVAEDIRTVSAAVGPEATEAARAEVAKLEEMRAAGAVAAQQFQGEPVANVGSQPWRVLWQAAQNFAAEGGTHLGGDHDPTHCPLCLQELDEAAHRRLSDFEAFVANDVSERLAVAERAVAERRRSLPDFETLKARWAPTLARMRADGAADAAEALEGWMDAVAEQGDRIRRATLDELGLAAQPPLTGLEAWIAQRAQHAKGLEALKAPEERKRLEKVVSELGARRRLADSFSKVETHCAALTRVQTLRGARAKLNTAGLSHKMTAWSRSFLTADFETALASYLRALNFQGLEVETANRTVSGAPRLLLRLKGVEAAPLANVLSTGEQRLLALAMFLAELSVSDDEHAVVLDDPLCSIDGEGRRHVAKALAKLAQSRQVVIFTHDLPFVQALQLACERNQPEVPMQCQYVKRVGRDAGIVEPELPWRGLRAKQRPERLQAKLKQVKAAHGDPDAYESAAKKFCADLREAFERTVEEEVLHGVVTRGTPGVETKKLPKVVLTPEILRLVKLGMNESSSWVHDISISDNSSPPAPADLADGLKCLEDLLAAIKKHRSESPPSRPQSASADRSADGSASGGSGPPEAEPRVRDARSSRP